MTSLATQFRSHLSFREFTEIDTLVALRRTRPLTGREQARLRSLQRRRAKGIKAEWSWPHRPVVPPAQRVPA